MVAIHSGYLPKLATMHDSFFDKCFIAILELPCCGSYQLATFSPVAVTSEFCFSLENPRGYPCQSV